MFQFRVGCYSRGPDSLSHVAGTECCDSINLSGNFSLLFEMTVETEKNIFNHCLEIKHFLKRSVIILCETTQGASGKIVHPPVTDKMYLRLKLRLSL